MIFSSSQTWLASPVPFDTVKWYGWKELWLHHVAQEDPDQRYNYDNYKGKPSTAPLADFPSHHILWHKQKNMIEVNHRFVTEKCSKYKLFQTNISLLLLALVLDRIIVCIVYILGRHHYIYNYCLATWGSSSCLLASSMHHYFFYLPCSSS